jgi:hypothetical protein
VLDGVVGQRYAPVDLHLGKRPGAHFTGSWLGSRAPLDGIQYPDVFMNTYVYIYIYVCVCVCVCVCIYIFILFI